jgi:hypothetical protein
MTQALPTSMSKLGRAAADAELEPGATRRQLHRREQLGVSRAKAARSHCSVVAAAS